MSETEVKIMQQQILFRVKERTMSRFILANFLKYMYMYNYVNERSWSHTAHISNGKNHQFTGNLIKKINDHNTEYQQQMLSAEFD